MSKKKYVAIQQTNYEWNFLTDDDGIKTAGGTNCEVFVIGDRDTCFLNEDEYKSICNTIDELVGEFDDLTYLKDKGYSRADINAYSYYQSYKDIVDDLLSDERYRKYSPLLIKKLKAFAENYDYNSVEQVAEFLTITTGMEWKYKTYRGYCQGDYCELIYCADKQSKEYMDLIGNGAVGCVTEFCISENPIDIDGKDVDEIVEEAREDCCYGFYLTDDDVWNEKKCKAELAEFAECELDEIAVITIEDTSYQTIEVNTYKVA